MQQAIIVGHPQSGYEHVLHLLQSSGMAPAELSRREQLTPQAITATLVKAHGALPLEKMQGEQVVHQVQVAPVWSGMVLDLMLGNVEQKLWGWAAPDALYLLDYWAEQDPKAVFVLVYDSPQTALSRLSPEQAAAPAEQLQQRLDGWAAYNAALLEFYLRNPDRSVLVHASQVRQSASRYLKILNACVDAPLQLPGASNRNPSATNDASAESRSLGGSLTPQVDKGNRLDDSTLGSLVLHLLLQQQPSVQTLFQELQAAATLPLEGADSALTLDGTEHFWAWQDCVRLHERANAVDRMQANNEALRRAESEALRQAEENDLLLIQLHKVQEELERYYLENQKLKLRYGAADRVKNGITYRAGDIIIKHSRTPWGWVSMPFAVYAEVRRYRKEKAARGGRKLPPISSYADAKEAAAVREQLAYRLGKCVVTNRRSVKGLLTMPWALRAEVRAYHKRQDTASASSRVAAKPKERAS